MFERHTLGDDDWARQAATKPRLFPSGAPVESFFPPEGVPIIPLAAGIPKTTANPNAAKLFLDWLPSAEGQDYIIREQGSLTSLKTWPVMLPGFDPAKNKVWLLDFQPFQDLLKPWMEEWNRIYGYRH